MLVTKNLSQLQSRFKDLLSKRYHRIYILPTQFGSYFILVIFILFLMSLSYGHSLAITGTFLFVSIVVMSTFYTNYNLSGIRFKANEKSKTYRPLSLFKGEDLVLKFKNLSKKPRPDLRFDLEVKRGQSLYKISGFKSFTKVQDHKVVFKTIYQNRSLKRGVYKIQSLKVSSHFPFGLFGAWSYLQLKDRKENLEFFLYPEPIKPPDTRRAYLISDLDNESDKKGADQKLGEDLYENLSNREVGDHFFEHRLHKESEGLRRVDWKMYARTHELYIKNYSSDDQEEIPLNERILNRRDYQQYPLESQLSFLCFRVMQMSKMDLPYSLILDSEEEPVWGRGKEFEKACLLRLCLFDLNREGDGQ